MNNGLLPMMGFPVASSAQAILPDGVIEAIATTQIQEGKIVTSGDYGINQLSTLVIPSQVQAGIRGSATASGVMNAGVGDVAGLTNGNFVVAGGVTSSNVGFDLYNPSGVIIGNNTVVESVVPDRVAVSPLSGGGFVVAYITGGSWKTARYSAGGGLVGSIDTLSGYSGVNTIDVDLLNNGDYVVVTSGSGGETRFGRYNASGTLQGSVTTIETGVNSDNARVSRLLDGGFIISYRLTSNGNPKFARYNASGTLQGSVTTVESVSSSLTAVAGLPDGGFVVGYLDNSGFPKFGRYNASGTLQGSLTTVHSLPINSYDLAGLSDGGFVAAYGTTAGNNTYFVRFNSSGVAQTPITVLGFGSNSPATRVSSLPNGEFVIGGKPSGNYTFVRYAGILQLVMGVALNSASPGGRVLIATGGAYGRPKSFPLADDWGSIASTFDARTLGGTAGTILGRTALLRGLS